MKERKETNYILKHKSCKAFSDWYMYNIRNRLKKSVPQISIAK